MARPLAGIKIIEIEGLGPVTFAGRHFMELGADVTLIKRPGAPLPGLETDRLPINHGKSIMEMDLKDAADRQRLIDLVTQADVLIEGMRPGVMEKLSLGPSDLAAVNRKLIYGRVTGWGQEGPLATSAGHDINYAALSGALYYSGQPGTPPAAPPTLLGDVAGGAHYLVIGVLAALVQLPKTGSGRVVDAAMVDGSAHMMNLLLTSSPPGMLSPKRGQSALDGSHFYNTYVCKDGGYITIGALEPQFYVLLLSKLGLDDHPDFQAQYDAQNWPALKNKLEKIFMAQTRDAWCELLDGTDVCFAPVLSPWEAPHHEHIKARQIYMESGASLKAAPAPRFGPLDPET